MNKTETMELWTTCLQAREAAGPDKMAQQEATKKHWNKWAKELQEERKALKQAGKWMLIPGGTGNRDRE